MRLPDATICPSIVASGERDAGIAPSVGLVHPAARGHRAKDSRFYWRGSGDKVCLLFGGGKTYGDGLWRSIVRVGLCWLFGFLQQMLALCLGTVSVGGELLDWKSTGQTG
jgi:hypothetical protein